MVAPAWLARLLQVDGEIDEDDLAARLAQRLRLQVPTGPEGRQVLVRFSLLGESLHRSPDELVRESLPSSPDEAHAAAAQLGLRTASDLERVLRLAARELWAWLGSQPPAAEKKRRPSSPGNRSPEALAEEERLAAFAAQAIAEARGEVPPAAPAPGTAPASTRATPEDRLQALAAEAIAEARGQASPAAAAAAAAVPSQPAPPPPAGATVPSQPAPPPPAGATVPSPVASQVAEPRTFGEQLQAAGPLIVFLATVGAGTIVALLVWLVGTAVGVFGSTGV